MSLMDRHVALAHYLEREFGIATDYSQPLTHKESLAYTTTEDGEHDITVEADPYDLTVHYYLDGDEVLEEQWTDEEWKVNLEYDNIFGALVGEVERIYNDILIYQEFSDSIVDLNELTISTPQEARTYNTISEMFGDIAYDLAVWYE